MCSVCVRFFYSVCKIRWVYSTTWRAVFCRKGGYLKIKMSCCRIVSLHYLRCIGLSDEKGTSSASVRRGGRNRCPAGPSCSMINRSLSSLVSVLKVNGKLDDRTIWRLWSKTNARPVYRTLNTRAEDQLRTGEHKTYCRAVGARSPRSCGGAGPWKNWLCLITVASMH